MVCFLTTVVNQGLCPRRARTVRAINKVFLELPEEKRRLILNAAFTEFGEQGYARASTNRVVAQAEISKGMLFYYFNSKNELFNDLANTALDHSMEKYEESFSQVNPDYIDWLYNLARKKFEYQQLFPEETRFLGQLYLSSDKDFLDADTADRFTSLIRRTQEQVEKNADTSMLRTDIPHDIAKKMVGWVIEGYQNDMVARMEADAEIWNKGHLDPFWDEYYEFLEVLKHLFYKKGKA